MRRACVPNLPATMGLAIALSIALLTCLPGCRGSREGSGRRGVDLSFPAESLRLDGAAPAFELMDHEGAAFSLAEQSGRVVLVTSVYTTCPKSCPMLLAETREAVHTLSPEQRAELRVAAITMDPENDDRARLAELAGGLGVQSPPFHFLGGSPDTVLPLLDRYAFARRKDPASGIIEHAQQVLLIDRRGRLAFKLDLGQEGSWLSEAIAHLLAESG